MEKPQSTDSSRNSNLSVFEKFDLPEPLLRFFQLFVRPSQVPSLAGNNLIAAFLLDDHGLSPVAMPRFSLLFRTANNGAFSLPDASPLGRDLGHLPT
jgi:hypothetical protein